MQTVIGGGHALLRSQTAAACGHSTTGSWCERALPLHAPLQFLFRTLCVQLGKLQNLTVCNDVFFIWAEAQFGTVNGLRLGSLQGQTVLSLARLAPHCVLQHSLCAATFPMC